MASATTRGLRSKSSRLSSPALAFEKDPEAKAEDDAGGKDGGKTFLDKWVEPPLRAPAPSFEDTRGLERVGVLEHMAPLGQLPTPKLLQKLKLGSHRPALRTALGRDEEVATPSTEVERIDMASPADAEGRSESIQPEETVPLSGSEGRRLSRQENGDVSPESNATPSPKKDVFSHSNSTSPKDLALISRSLPPLRLQAHFEGAIKEAEHSGSSNLVPGLRKLYEDAQTDPDLLTVLEAILNNTPTQAQFKTFKRYIKYGIKKFENPNSEDLADVDLRPRSQIRVQNGVSTSNLDENGPPANPSSSTTSPIRLKLTSVHRHRGKSPSKRSLVSSNTLTSHKMSSAGSRSNGNQSSGQGGSRRRRSRSISSSSSLSSAKSIPESFAPPMESDGTVQVNGGRAARPGGPRQAANRVAAGNKTRSSAATSHASKNPFADFKTASHFAAKKFKKSKEDLEFDQAELEKRRRDFENRSFRDYNNLIQPDSHERMAVAGVERPRGAFSMPVPPPVVHPHPLNPLSIALSSPKSNKSMTDQILINGTRRKRGYHEIDQDDADNPTPRSSPGPSLAPPPSGVAASSRAATPRAAKAPPVGKVRKSARVMVSPNKPKNGGITAGFSRTGPPRDQVTSNGGDSSAEDNDEYCASCGGEGTLLCCDGCPNSFHHTCLEPPLDPEKEVDGEWFCPRCIAQRNRGPISTSGLFGPIFRIVDDTIPKAFSLPFEIRDYFEGVKTGEEGEYEEIGLPRTQNNSLRMNRAGFIEEPNYKELRDTKNNFIVCYRCGLTANGRDIIPCDYCPARWHLDCLDPPLAVAPRRRGGDKPNASWRCPLHVEHDLARIGRSDLAAPGEMGRFLPRLRRPKHAIPLDAALPRGFRNNGVIDVDMMKEDEIKIHEVEMHGHVYKIPEHGIRLDFIDRVKKSWYEDQTFPVMMQKPKHVREHLYRPDVLPRPVKHRPTEQEEYQKDLAMTREEPAQLNQGFPSISATDSAAIVEANAAVNAALRNKTLREQQTVLNLARMSKLDNGRQADSRGENGTGDKLADLTHQLVIDAPEAVLDLERESEKEMLERLMKLVKGRLKVLEPIDADGQPPEDEQTENTNDAVVTDAAAAGTTPQASGDGGSKIPVNATDEEAMKPQPTMSLRSGRGRDENKSARATADDGAVNGDNGARRGSGDGPPDEDAGSEMDISS